MQVLTEAKLLDSFRGPNGGVGFLKPAHKVRLIEIVAAVDGTALFTDCALGLPGCGEATPCPLHNAWAKRRSNLKSMLSKTTLAALARDINSNKLRN
jgi:Rrf2 family protein